MSQETRDVRSRYLLLLLIATASVGLFLVTAFIAVYPCGNLTYCESLPPRLTTLIDRQGAEPSFKALPIVRVDQPVGTTGKALVATWLLKDNRQFSNYSFAYLTEPVRWQPSGVYEGRYQEVIVPKGFVTGLASVPAIFWAIYPPSDLGPYLRMARAAVIHDYLYWTQTRPRAVADEILKIQMTEIGLSSFNVQRIYWGIRLFKEEDWKGYKIRRETGENRLLDKVPTAETDWIEWRRNHKE
jgi:Protein of unknown function (DUF1353)